jgi:glycosyltransferase involved in cell wall biosynthesis
MKDNVIFTGFMDDVREAVSIADIGFVLSIGVETISFACREMMAMGKPVLVSDYAGLSENINHHHDGWIVQQKSTSQIQEFLQKIKALDLNQYSDLAKQKAEKEFGLKDFFDKTIKLYRGLECN